ncbi:patatin-like phospholipase family protein [candidate division FCPU426 bacterium]|nr:patatin-like phospholipase family protein [candidate division FCPU426 bacterium]
MKTSVLQRNRLAVLCMPLLLLCWFCKGCALAPVKDVKPIKVALVLGGGGARGFAHVGVIRELESAGIPIDMMVGVSVGSLIGALYADTSDSFKLEWSAFKIEKNEIFDFKVFGIAEGLAKGEAILRYIDNNIESRFIEDLKIPLAIVAVDINTGTQVVFRTGRIRDAIRASISVPGVFSPMPYQDTLLVDGGVLGNLAPQVARKMGADIVIGVNIAKPRKAFDTQAPNALAVILESIGIMGDEIVRLRKNDFDFLIQPEVGNIGITDFSKKKELIEAGRQAAKKEISRIKQSLQ